MATRKTILFVLTTVVAILQHQSPAAAPRSGGQMREPGTPRPYDVFREFTIREFKWKAGGEAPEKLVAFFTKHFTDEPYVGPLRGEHAVLATKAANSLDAARFLATAIRSSRYQTRIVSLGSHARVLPTRPAKPRDLDAGLDRAASSTLTQLLALGDGLFAEHLMPVSESGTQPPRTVHEERYGVQILDVTRPDITEWRTIYGQSGGDQPPRPIDLQILPSGRLEFSVDLVVESGGRTSIQNVLRADYDLDDIAFRPAWLDFIVSSDSVRPVLHRQDQPLQELRSPSNRLTQPLQKRHFEIFA